MERRGILSAAGDWLWFLGLAVASSVWCVTAAGTFGATFDEPVYIQRGLEGWRSGSHSGLIHLGTMPLPADLDTLPIYLWERWHGFSFDPVRDLPELLPWARACTLVFWWLLLFYARLAGRSLAGPWGGRLAVALLACEPSLLAHASLATTDVAITACVLAFVYHFRTGREAGRLRRVVVPLLWFGVCLLAKASALVYGPICMLAVESERLARCGGLAGLRVGGLWRRLGALWSAYRPLRRDGAWIFAGGVVLAFVYCGCDWQPQPSFVAWAHRLPDAPPGRFMVWLAEHLCVFTNAGEGIVRQIKHNMHGHGVYLLGQRDPCSIWYYFPVLLTIKLTVPLLLAPLLLALLRPRALLNWAAVTAAVLLGFSLTFRVQIGIRLVLPLVAMAGVGLGAAAAEAYRTLSSEGRRRLFAGGAAAGLLWMGVVAMRAWPNGLGYVNELWGGSEHGYRWVSESNYDWGHGLPELAEWQRGHGIGRMAIWYFGTDPRFDRLQLQPLRLHDLPLKGPEDVLAQVRGRHLAVSSTLLYGPPMNLEGYRATQRLLHSRQPVARTSTFFIFDFTHEDEPAPQAASRPGR
jgi:hypothetical protein